MAIAVALPKINDLGRTVTPTFLSRNRFYSQLSLLCQKMNKKSTWEKKFKISVQGIESCHLEATSHLKLWSLDANLFFKEPHQLAKFTY